MVLDVGDEQSTEEVEEVLFRGIVVLLLSPEDSSEPIQGEHVKAGEEKSVELSLWPDLADIGDSFSRSLSPNFVSDWFSSPVREFPEACFFTVS